MTMAPSTDRQHREHGRRRFLQVALVSLVLLGFFGFRYGRTVWQAWRIHRPECIVWTGNYAIGAHRGTYLWGVEKPSCYPDSIASGTVVVVVDDGGALDCRSVLDGTTLWQAGAAYTGEANPSHTFTTSIVGNTVYQAGSEGVRALDVRTGQMLWSTAVLQKFSAYLSVIPHGSGFVLFGGTSLQWYDKPGPTPRWEKAGTQDQVARFDGDSFVAGMDASVVRVSIESGEEIWRVSAPEKVPRYLRVHAAGPYVVAGGDSWAYCIDGATGKVLWSTTGKVRRSSPDVQRENRSPEATIFSPEQGLLLLALNTGQTEILALRTDTWATVWSRVFPMDTVVLLLEGDRAFIGNYESRSCGAALVCVHIKEGQQLWHAPAQGISVAHSSYSNKVRLFRRENWISLIGCAGAGDYVETFNADTGEVISRWRSAEGE